LSLGLNSLADVWNTVYEVKGVLRNQEIGFQWQVPQVFGTGGSTPRACVINHVTVMFGSQMQEFLQYIRHDGQHFDGQHFDVPAIDEYFG